MHEKRGKKSPLTVLSKAVVRKLAFLGRMRPEIPLGAAGINKMFY